LTPLGLSIVVPVYNEAESLPMLVARLTELIAAPSSSAEAAGADTAARLPPNALPAEVLLVDDGSRDGSWERIEAACRADRRFRGVRLRRNFGKAAALAAGIDAAGGRLIVTLDADLQDDPAEIPKLLAKLDEGYDLVSGWKQQRHDPWHKVWPSWAFNRVVGWLTGLHLHDHNCGLKAYRRELFSEVRLYGEMHRFVPVLAAARGWRVAEVAVRHQPRRFGSSKYGVERFVKGFLDLLTVYFLTGYRQRPQHLLGSTGLLGLLVGLLLLGWLTAQWWLTRWIPGWTPIHLHQRAIFYYALVGVLVGVQLLAVGFLAELIIARERTQLPTYSVSDRAGQWPVQGELESRGAGEPNAAECWPENSGVPNLSRGTSTSGGGQAGPAEGGDDGL
jgi:glycosyltransferase involved in cell wall biosynthesis